MTGDPPAERAAARRARLLGLAATLPEAEVLSGDPHASVKIRKRTVAYYTDDHHGDGRIALWVKVGPGEQEAMLAEDPERFFRPPYMGHHGWIAMRLDTPEVDWDEVHELLMESYRLVAPKRLAARLDEERIQ